MKLKLILLPVALLSTMLVTTHARAQSAFGGEIVSYNTFGEGLSVTRAKAAAVNGTVSNIFFYNRADAPWTGSEWYEYDWELRGGFSDNGMSQLRVRPQGEEKLISTPNHLDIDGGTTAGLLHYILIRKDNRYVYDVRRDFNVNTYNYNNADAHDGNSASALLDGPRVVITDNNSDNKTPNHIPSWKELDFSLGVTAFDIIAWSGPLPDGDFNGVMQVDFTRFYTYTGDALNTTPQWSDEFIGTSLDFGKWKVADWTFYETQFRLENIKVQDGSLFMRVNRGGATDWNPPSLALQQPFQQDDPVVQQPDSIVQQSEAVVPQADSVAEQADPVVQLHALTDGSTETATNNDMTNSSVTSDTDAATTPTLEKTTPMQVGVGAFGWGYLLLLGGLVASQRRFLKGQTD